LKCDIFHDIITDVSSECGGTLTTDTGDVTSPHYPAKYSNNMHCEWLIMLDADRTNLTLEFTDLEIEGVWPGGCMDYVEVG
jgi:hypothetical protein